LLIASSIFFMLNSTWGTRFLFKQLALFLGPHFTYEQVQGKILGKLEINQLRYQGDGLQVRIKHLSTNTSLHLLKRKLIINYLRVDGSTFKINFIQSNSKKIGTFYLPLEIDSRNIRITQSQVVLGKHTYNLPDVTANIHLIRQDVTYPFDFTINATLEDKHNGSLALISQKQSHNFELLAKVSHFHIKDVFVNNWPSQISCNLLIKQEAHKTHFILDSLTGQINHYEVGGKGILLFENKQLINANVFIHSQEAKLEIKKSLNQIDAISWLLHVPSLHQFSPNHQGSLEAAGEITDLITQPFFQGELQASDLKSSTLSIKQLSSHFSLPIKKMQEACTNLIARKVQLGKLYLDNINLNIKGSLNHHKVNLNAKSKNQVLQLALEGGYEKPQWKGIINQLSISHQSEIWRLANPTSVIINYQKASMDKLSLLSGNAHIAVGGDYNYKEGPSGYVIFHQFNLKLLEFLLPQTCKLDGKLDIDGTFDYSQVKRISIRGIVNDGYFSYGQGNEAQKYNIHQVTFLSYLEKNNLISRLSANLGDGNLISRVILPNFNFFHDLQHQVIEGQVALEYHKPAFLEVFIPLIKNVTGTIEGKYRLLGSLAHPNVTGDLNVKQGAFQIPKLNLSIDNVNISAHSENKLINYKGTLSSGKGFLRFTGHSKIEDNRYPIDVDLDGNHVLICNQPEIKIFASPEMHLTLSQNQLNLSGKLFIPEANIHPHDFGNTETASEDIIFTDKRKPAESSNLKIKSQIQLILGNKISLSSRGIKGQVLGRLQIIDDPTRATVATGELRLQNGSYSIYGKSLEIDDGKLIFSGGPISNPGLNIRASRTLQIRTYSLFAQEENIKAGVRVTGTLNEPKVNLFSEPAGKSPEDILSYLILGVPISSINKNNQANTQLLLQAADALNINGNNKLFNIKDKVKNRLGLAELDIGTQSEIDPTTQKTTQHTAFILGKYLSPKFYINYSLDLFDHTNTLKVRYLINKFWTIQSIANTNSSGVDILYSVEKS